MRKRERGRQRERERNENLVSLTRNKMFISGKPIKLITTIS